MKFLKNKFIWVTILAIGCGVIYLLNMKPVSKLASGQRNYESHAAGATIKLDYDAVHQRIEGFGASGAWWAQDVGGWDNLGDIMDLLYDDKKGIGLNIYRYNIGAGKPIIASDPWRSAETLEVSPGVYDLDRDRNAINAMKEAAKRGATIELFANSPPARLTKSGYSSGETTGKSNLPPENEEQFAKYLVDITELFLKEGIPVTYISPINEPQWDWKSGQEGCHYEPEQVISLSRKVALELERRKLPVKLLIAESGAWNDPNYTLTMYKRIMNDDVLSKAIDAYAVHSYWSSEKDKKIAASYFSQFENMLPLYQTEWCEMKNGNAASMDAALVLARTIHEDMTILSVSVWEQWLAVAKGDYRDGLVYVDEATRKFGAVKRMWSFGNYSKFIKPGYRRIEAESQDSDVLVSAYVSPQKDKTVIVAINPTKHEKAVSFENVKGKKTKIYETSEKSNLALIKEVSGLGNVVLPAESVTTFVIQAGIFGFL
ncbi:glycoside hydrolase family 30 protein [Paenibacillus thermotolerans]|uniref:glycoside hydrolase family 30 protein n=1 Tax=Paenibacillus thermotolerans TaxID=3027807 RepID=UPI002367DD9D|nr:MULTISPECIES: glycoside hydrolase [unclassified Paenibacillus]